jgi:hypothetical protein
MGAGAPSIAAALPYDEYTQGLRQIENAYHFEKLAKPLRIWGADLACQAETCAKVLRAVKELVTLRPKYAGGRPKREAGIFTRL